MPAANYTATEKYCPECGEQSVALLRTRTQTGRQRFKCTECSHRTCFPLKFAPPPPVEFATELPKAKRFVITTAQNATPIDRRLLRSFRRYCDFHAGTQMVVLGIRYKNPTSIWAREDRNSEWWDSKVTPYLFAGRVDINDNLMLMGDIKTQPTAEQPLSGLGPMSRASSAIFAHTKVALKTIATPQSELPKMLWTTGAITVPNYTDTKTGAKGEFHHSMGALVVEVVDDKIFHVRQLNACSDGSFMDVAGGVVRRYHPRGVQTIDRIAGISLGDSHVDSIDPSVDEGTYGSDGIIAATRPREIVHHDVSDSYAVGKHHRKRPIIRIVKRITGRDNVMAEVARTCEFIVAKTPKDSRAIIVASNHLDHLSQWIDDADWKEEGVNAELYLETALHMVRNARMTPAGVEYPDPFYSLAQRIIGKRAKVVYLGRDLTHTIKGIVVSFHGDKGINGARGSIGSFRGIGAKTIIGHSHTPGIMDGSYQVGTSSLLGLEYNSGLSSWFHTHCLIYPNGKRTLINIIGGQWRLTDVGTNRKRRGRAPARDGAAAGRRAA